MNTHVSKEIQDKWMNYDFIGKPFRLSDGKTYIRAHSKTFEETHFYCVEEDFFWHDRPRINITQSIVEA